MSDLFTGAQQNRITKIYVTRDLRDQVVVKRLRDLGFSVKEFDEQKISNIEQSIIACYPGKGRVLDEKVPASSFLVLFDADDALERLMSKRTFFVDSANALDLQLGIFEALDEVLCMRRAQTLESIKIKEWDDKVQEALSGFDYLIKSLPNHCPGDVHQDEGLADLIDFFVRVLVFKERSVSITAEKQFFDSLTQSFDDFDFDFNSETPIPVGSRKWNATEKELSKYSLLKTMGLAFLVSEFEDQIEVLEKQRKEESLWEDTLNHLPYAVALISASGDLVAQNPAFTQLSIFPADCLKLRPQQKVELNNSIYRVEKIKLDAASAQHDEELFAFFFRDDAGAKTRRTSNEDLGIISSSIAHELNNPLAGILASLSLAELEDDIDEEALQAIRDMKQSAKRCKELVEIFLGFSRANPHQATSSAPGFEAIEKAISLSRFRMIESNLRVEVETQFVHKFHRETNISILAMVWYLVISELLTSSSHHNLVTGESSQCIGAKFVEREHALELIVDSDFDWWDGVSKSKLLLHLVELAGLSMTFDQNKLTLQDWTLT